MICVYMEASYHTTHLSEACAPIVSIVIHIFQEWILEHSFLCLSLLSPTILILFTRPIQHLTLPPSIDQFRTIIIVSSEIGLIGWLVMKLTNRFKTQIDSIVAFFSQPLIAMTQTSMQHLALRSILSYKQSSYKNMVSEQRLDLDISIEYALYALGFTIRDITDALKSKHSFPRHSDPEFPHSKAVVLALMGGDRSPRSIQEKVEDDNITLDTLHAMGFWLPDLAGFFPLIEDIESEESNEVISSTNADDPTYISASLFIRTYYKSANKRLYKKVKEYADDPRQWPRHNMHYGYNTVQLSMHSGARVLAIPNSDNSERLIIHLDPNHEAQDSFSGAGKAINKAYTVYSSEIPKTSCLPVYNWAKTMHYKEVLDVQQAMSSSSSS